MARTRKQRRLKGGQGIKRPREDDSNLRLLAEQAALASPLEEVAPAAPAPVPASAKTRKRSVSRSRASTSALTATPEEALQYHLKADMEHDHSETRPKKSIFEADQFPELENLVPRAMKGSLNEDSVRDFFVEGVTPLDSSIPNKKERAELRTRFVMPPETSDTYSADFSKLFQPFGGLTNEKVGVLQDAGVQIYKLMGARNIITYGSILDQASKPKKDAYYFFNKDASVKIELNPADFGFDTTIVKSITVNKFSGQQATCECSFNINGVRRGTERPIELNKRNGDFKCVDEVRQTWTEIKAKKGAGGYTAEQLVDAYAAFVGKALGDILLVASLDINDPLYPVGEKLTPLLSTKAGTIQVEQVLLNTGDRLNHVRAFIRNVHSMYSSANPNTKLRTYEFLPGSMEAIVPRTLATAAVAAPAPAPVKTVTNRERIRMMKNAVKTVYERYTNLLKHLDTITPALTKRDGGGVYVEAEKADELAIFINDLKLTVDALRTYVGFYYLVFYRAHEKETETDPEVLTEICDILLREVTFLAPQFETTLKKNDSVVPILTLLRAKPLLFSTYQIVAEGSIKYEQEVNNVYVATFNDIVGEKTIPYQTVHSELAELTGVKSDKSWIPTFPLNVVEGGISGVLAVRLCDIYNLIGSGRPYTPYQDVLLFRQTVEAPGPGPVTGGGSEETLFANKYYAPTVNTTNILGPDVDERVDIQSDLVADFVGTRPVKEAIREFLIAKGTFAVNPAQCFDTTLFEVLGDAIEDTFGEEFKVLSISTEKSFSTSEALRVNAFMCERAKDILDTYITKEGEILPAESELGKVFTDYVKTFRELAALTPKEQERLSDSEVSTPKSEASFASTQTGSLGPGIASLGATDSSERAYESDTTTGGQRVEDAKFIIDATKSFVRYRPSYPISVSMNNLNA
jgi:hypothetical protein